jgi:hypothetical protein
MIWHGWCQSDGSRFSRPHAALIAATKAKRHVVADKDRYEAEGLLPVFQAVGLAADVAASTEFTACEAGELYIR